MKHIPLTQGKTAMVSDADFWLARQFNWRAYRQAGGHIWRAIAYVLGSGAKNQKTIYLHRLLAGFPPFKLDHKNRNGLDNRRSNLRPATPAQNAANQKRNARNMSGVKGVHRRGDCDRWRARIVVAGKSIHLGHFLTRQQAGEAYLAAATKYFGEFARAA